MWAAFGEEALKYLSVIILFGLGVQIVLSAGVGASANTANTKVFLTSSHIPELAEFFDETYTNDSLHYPSAFRPFRNLSAHLVGSPGMNWSVEYAGTNITKSGTLNSTYERVILEVGDDELLWIIVTFDNRTFNFGEMTISKAPVVITDRPEADTILREEARAQTLGVMWRTVVGSALFAFALYISIATYKRGKVIEW